MASVTLASRRERSVLRRHPWIFSSAVSRVDGDAASGSTVDVLDATGSRLARGAWSPRSQIAVRVWTFDPDERVGPELFGRCLDRAVRSRARYVHDDTCTAFRLVNAESDGLPGVTVDRYDRFLVAQLTSAGAEAHRQVIGELLRDRVPCAGAWERSEAPVRRKEGLDPVSGPLWGEPPPERVEIVEGRCRFLVDLRRGHKTGFYLDQRDSRACVAEHAAGAEVLNCFAYTGAFGVAAMLGGASRCINVESSPDALELAATNAALNGIEPSRFECVRGDVFETLRRYRDRDRRFDLVVLDPPRFAGSKRQVERACRGYKDVNLLAFKLLRPGGLLFTFSCSGHVGADLFDKIVAGAAVDAGRDVRVLRRLDQPEDHAHSLHFPEGRYLKGLVCRVA